MPIKTKQRNHNEWFRIVSLGNRKSCPSCKAKLSSGESLWSWGEYVYAKWRTITHFRKECWPDIRDQLNQHTGDCGCTVTLVVKDPQPEWMTLSCQSPRKAS